VPIFHIDNGVVVGYGGVVMNASEVLGEIVASFTYALLALMLVHDYLFVPYMQELKKKIAALVHTNFGRLSFDN
jgi:hypothetical protein